MWNTHAPRPGTVALAGLLSLAAAMGIGRFAFTPLLPLMLREGNLPVAWAGWLAAANYLGYFLGALSAARLPLGPRALAAAALTLTALATAAMAWTAPALWLALRFLAGAASAWVFVATSVWGLGALARNGQAGLAGWVYAGVGAGIALTGLYCLPAWAASQLLMGAGVLLPALWLNAFTLAACALLVGGTFMVITLAGVQEMRARAPADATRLVGRITAAFALGQIAGPLLPALLHQAGLGPRALPVSLELGAVGLLASGAWLWRRALSTSPSQETAHA
jgi:hypothetical protein